MGTHTKEKKTQKKEEGRKDAKKKKTQKKKKTSISQLRNHLRHGLRFSRTTWVTQGRTSRPLNSEAGSIILVCSYIEHKRWLANFVIILDKGSDSRGQHGWPNEGLQGR